MAERVTLYTKEYLVGNLSEDLTPLTEMIMDNFNKNRFMAEGDRDIRSEDVRINFTPQVQRIVQSLITAWKDAYGKEIELCWAPTNTHDPNTSFWAVVHGKHQTTNVHTHESALNYESGAHVSVAYYVQVPEDSGNLIFRYNINPYVLRQTEIQAEPNKFVMFDSTLAHFVTKNNSDDNRIVISMNFKFKD